MAQLIDGKLISQQIKDELKEEVAQFKAEGIDICLAVIQVGSDPASSVYVRNKKKRKQENIRSRRSEQRTLNPIGKNTKQF